MALTTHLRTLGGIARRADIWVPDAALTEAVRSGELIRPRRGWYALPTTPAPVLTALKLGALTGASVFALLGAWQVDATVHIRVSPTAARLKRIPGTCVHYQPGPLTAVDNRITAAIETLRCLPLPDAVAVLDSALHAHLLSPDELSEICQRARPGMRPALAHLSPLAESGIESAVRVFLRSARIPYTEQFVVPRVCRADFLVGKSLIVEVDGFQYHTGASYHLDRQKELALRHLGYQVVRLSYQQVTHDWPQTRDKLLRLFRTGLHLKPLKPVS